MASWFGRKKQRLAPAHGDLFTNPPAPPHGDLFTNPPDPPHGIYSGTLLARKERTWAGCVIMPDEAARMPTVLMLQLGDLCAPLKWLDPRREADLV